MPEETQTDVVYDTTVVVVGGRDGSAESEDGRLKISLAVPKAMGGSGQGSNPEQLFAAGFAACFESSVRGLARAQKILIEASQVDSRVAIVRDGAGGFTLRVSMAVALRGPDQATAQRLVDEAEQVCPYARAVKGNIAVAIEVRALS